MKYLLILITLFVVGCEYKNPMAENVEKMHKQQNGEHVQEN